MYKKGTNISNSRTAVVYSVPLVKMADHVAESNAKMRKINVGELLRVGRSTRCEVRRSGIQVQRCVQHVLRIT